MKRQSVVAISIFFVFVVLGGCRSSRKIPVLEIPNYTSIIKLYEAKYKYSLNSWWESPNSHTLQFSIATNTSAVARDFEELFAVSELYCKSRGGTFSHEDLNIISRVDAGTRSRDMFPVDVLLKNRMANPEPSFNCMVQSEMFFSGYIVRRMYATSNGGGSLGDEVIIWVLTTE